jgi:glutamine synthetase
MTAARPGILTLEELEAKVKTGEIATIQVVFVDCYGRFMGKRVPGAFFLKSVAKHGMHACNYLLTVDMEMEPVPGYQYANWQGGYGDFHCVPDLGTLRQCTWLAPRSCSAIWRTSPATRRSRSRPARCCAASSSACRSSA